MAIYVGTMGERGSGKSELGRMLREQAVSSPAADIEYSDQMIEIVNQALATIYRAPDGFVRELIKATSRVTHTRLVDRSYRWFRESNRAEIQAQLEEWLKSRGRSRDVRVTRDNKLSGGHVAPLVWIGIFMRMPEFGGPTLFAEEIGRRLGALDGEPLVTVGGCRFAEDLLPVWRRGGIVIDVLRHEITGDTDPTNQQRAKIKADVVVNNHGSLEELRSVAGQLHADLVAGHDLHRKADVPKVYGRPSDMIS